jgi:hypothetical protein
MANSSAPQTRHHLPFAKHRGDARSHGLQHLVAGCVSEQVVDFLEPVEIETEHCETFALSQSSNFLKLAE